MNNDKSVYYNICGKFMGYIWSKYEHNDVM